MALEPVENRSPQKYKRCHWVFVVDRKVVRFKVLSASLPQRGVDREAQTKGLPISRLVLQLGDLWQVAVLLIRFQSRAIVGKVADEAGLLCVEKAELLSAPRDQKWTCSTMIRRGACA